MAWIELHDTLPDHPKVIDLAELLRLDKDAVVGKLVRLWTWALGSREDGRLRRRDLQTLADVMRWKGKAQRLADALVEVRLLDPAEDGWVIHDWDEHVSMLMETRERKREQARLRKQRQRDKKRDTEPVNVDDSHAAVTRDIERDSHACHAVTVPKPYIDDLDPTTSILNARARGEIHKLSTTDTTDCGKAVDNYGRELTPADAMILQGWEPHFDRDAIRFALDLADLYGAREPVQYASTVLAEWFRMGIRTEAEARARREDRADDV